MFRRGLFWKFFGASVFLILLTSLVAGWVASRQLADGVRAQTEASLRTQVVLLHAQLSEALPPGPDAAFQARVLALGRETGTRITIVRADGLVLADSSKDPAIMDNHADRPEILDSRTQPFGRSIRHSDTVDMAMVYVSKRVEGRQGVTAYVRGSLPLLQFQERQKELYVIVLGSALVAIVLGLVAALFVAQRLTRPLQSMGEAALAIAGGDFERRVPASRSDEIGALGRTFNLMAGRLQREIGTIRRERRELRAILGGMAEGVIAVDSEERIVLMNEAAGVIFDIDPGEAKGNPIWEVLRLPAVPQALTDAVETAEAIRTEIDLVRDGREQTIRLHASPLAGREGARRGAVLVLEDVTDRRRLDAVRRDFIANASHELKTPVAAIRGLIETIIEDPEMDLLTRRGFLDRVLRQSDRLGGVVEEMLSLSRLESDGLKLDAAPHDIRGPIQEALDDAAPLAAEHGVGVDARLADDALRVRGEGEAVRRIVGQPTGQRDQVQRAGYSGARAGVSHRRHGGGRGHRPRPRHSPRQAGTGLRALLPCRRRPRTRRRRHRLGLAIVKHLVQSMEGT